MAVSIEAHSRRRWWPDEYIDEMVPEGRPTPDAWLARLDDGAHAVADDDDLGLGPIRLTEGQEIVFNYCDTLGFARIAQTDEGDVVLLPDPPAGTNHFWIVGDEDTITDDAETFKEQARDYGHIGEFVTYSTWGEGVRLRFTAMDGPPRLVPLGTMPGAPADAVSAPADDDDQGDLLTSAITKTEA